MYRKIEDFIADWKSEASSTIKIFSKVTEEVKAYKAGENIRSLERLAWHITQTLTEMPFRDAIIEADFLDSKPIPERFEQIISDYQKHSSELMKLVQEKLKCMGNSGKEENFWMFW